MPLILKCTSFGIISEVIPFLYCLEKTFDWFLCLIAFFFFTLRSETYLKMSLFRVYLDCYLKIIPLINIVEMNRKKHPAICSVSSPMTCLSFLVGKRGNYPCQEIHTMCHYYLTAHLQQKPK
uniref:Uncharacterized protein n=1 Tax=Rousettus aegyptiacus TaxID=9407 RepID=A0A7J8F086_ROUAE|nr:hypothetical protein HJG63_012318 [Rousettus aegyptiacus]